jgi:UDP:flavonoid glycosyltransferase YjiC (YdhE family)
MRVLITIQPAHGHLHALVPLARALHSAGHEVAFASSPSFLPAIQRLGFHAFAAGHDWLESDLGRAFPEIRMFPPGSERAGWFVMNLFAGPLARQMATDVLALGREWRPDLIVRDPNEYGGCIAAERLDLPHASSSKGLFPDPEMTQGLIGRSLSGVREACGLPPDDAVTMLTRYLDVAFVPPHFLDRHDVVAPIVHFIRPMPFNDSGQDEPPQWLGELPPRPTIHVTVGTVFNSTPDAMVVLRAILDGLRDEAVNLIVTVGRNVDPTVFGPQPEQIKIEPYVAHERLLPYCDGVVTHAGFNTVMAALGCGLPLVAVPLGADQFRNAARCETHGLGIVISPDTRTPDAMRDSIRRLLDDPMFRLNAGEMRSHMAGMPGAEHAVELLERLAVERVPLPAPRPELHAFAWTSMEKEVPS